MSQDGNDIFDAGRAEQRDGMLDERFSSDLNKRLECRHAGGKPRGQNDGAELIAIHHFGGGRGAESTAP